MQNENSGNGMLLIGVGVLIFFPVFFLVAVIALVGLCLIGVKPKIAGIGLILFSFVLFGLMIQVADDSDSFVPFMLAFLTFFLGGCALLISGFQKTAVAQPTDLSQSSVSQTQTPTEPFCPKEGDEEKVELAIQEARRIAGLTQCSHEGRKRIFEQVFKRQCQRHGVKVSKLAWKKNAS